MKLIKYIGRRLNITGKSSSSWGLFLCDFCLSKVERSYHAKKVKSCGCNHGLLKHGERKNKTKLYHVWKEMRERCYDPKNKSYRYYGGRGISVCDEWISDYITFRQWALTSGYKEGLTIDRKDNDENYSSRNCRWVTRAINNLNKRHKYKRKEKLHDPNNLPYLRN